jgi:hypothetical protein
MPMFWLQRLQLVFNSNRLKNFQPLHYQDYHLHSTHCNLTGYKLFKAKPSLRTPIGAPTEQSSVVFCGNHRGSTRCSSTINLYICSSNYRFLISKTFIVLLLQMIHYLNHRKRDRCILANNIYIKSSRN